MEKNNTHHISNKIPCTIGMLTLNSAEGLPACLESVRDFAEIIVCDGNSTDETIAIAKRFGAIVIPQYDTDEKNLSCVKDKAYVRQVNMDAAHFDWYFFMDSDDTLSPEVVEEIRAIVTDPKPMHLVYRMPTRIFMDGKEVKYEATYPSYQTRLVNRAIAPHFKGRVHDRLVFDEKKYPVGTLKNFYNFGWFKNRVQNFWPYLRRYAGWEIETMEFASFAGFLYWGIYKRLRTIAGYLFYRLPKMYFTHGFEESMPLSIELTIVRYHLTILWWTIIAYIKGARPVIAFIELCKGKDANRILSNIAVRKKECYGKILDIGGGNRKASHYRFLKLTKWMRLTTVDIDPKAKPDVLMNMENEPLPFAVNTFDFIFAFNILEHLKGREKILMQALDLLKPGGEFIGVIPFLVNVHPDPYDYTRLTKQGLEDMFSRIGFSSLLIREVGTGPFLAGYYQIEFLIPRIIRLVLFPLVLVLDRLLWVIKSRKYCVEKFPLSYVFYAKK